MHDIKFIKNNPLVFDEALKKRNLIPLSKEIISLHEEYLKYLNEKQALQEQKNSLSKSFTSKNVEIEVVKKQVQDIKKKIDELTTLSEVKFNELTKLLLNIQRMKMLLLKPKERKLLLTSNPKIILKY